MEGDEGRVEERGREDGQNILKISIFREPSPLLSSPLLSLLPTPSQTYPNGCSLRCSPQIENSKLTRLEASKLLQTALAKKAYFK